MSIKGKLITVSVLIGLVLGLLAALMLWSSVRTTQQVKAAGVDLDELEYLAKTRAAIIRQTKEAMDYLVSGEEQDRADFEAYGLGAKEQLAVLCSLYCDQMQGFLFSPPVPAEELTRLLREGRHLKTGLKC
jgi:hypothetical protein